jgi:hypothetical protein
MRTKYFLFFCLTIILTGYSNFSFAVTPEITILTSGLGKEGDKFPSDLIKLWETIDVNSTPVAPKIKLLRIDLAEEKELAVNSPQSIFDKIITPDSRVILMKIHDQLEKSIISKEFSNSVSANQNQIQAAKKRYSSDSKAFTVAQTNSPATNQFTSVNELLPALKTQIANDIAKGINPLKYSVFYKLPAIAVKPPVIPKPPVEETVEEKKPVVEKKPIVPNTPKPSVACTLAPVSTQATPNWYGVIEIGAKGIKPIAVNFKENLAPLKYDDDFGTQDVTPIKDINTERTVNAVCDNINKFHSKYGNLPIYIVGSSSMAIAPHKDKLVAAINKAVQISMDFITAEDEAKYLGKGIWTSPELPTYRHCESAVVSIGSGNIKGGHIENCDSKVREGKDEKFIHFEIKDFGTVKFTEQTLKLKHSNFIDAAKNTRATLEEKLNEIIHSHPELTNGKKRLYLEGGAVWMMSTLLCLDCPQYDHRSVTDDQDKYTVIKPKDIEVFYEFVTRNGKEVCDHQKENPYLRVDMDEKYKGTYSQKRIDEQKAKIEKVCKVFSAPNDFISTAEILRSLKKTMGFEHPESHIFFMQNNLYTWSRQYLIEKIQQGATR